MGKKLCRYIIEALLDIIFPQPITCTNCNRILNDKNTYNLCSNCLSQIQEIEENNTLFEKSRNIDGHEFIMNFDEVICACKYKGLAREIVHYLKYNDKRQVAITMASMIKKRIKDLDMKFDLIVPVPISVERLRKRGYNQSQIIANELSNLTGIRVENCIKRKKDTKSQVLLNGYMRWYNVMDAFECSVDLKYKNILLIDDVITTGATLNFCAEVLKDNGAQIVIAAAFAG